jgi:hypothetical protein
MAYDPPSEHWEKMLTGIDFSSLAPAPKEIDPKKNERVFVQKIVTEVYIFTDTDAKTYGSGTVQDIVVLGEMDKEAALKIIADRKGRRRKS